MDFKKFDVGKVRKISSWTFLGLLLGILIFVLFPLLPIKNNYSLMMVTSGSMSPTIKIGDLIAIKPQSFYKIGDIITFKVGPSPKDIVTHRIVARKEDNLVTKGDANDVIDEGAIKKQNILGKVILRVPKAGYIANILKSKIAILTLVLLPAILIIIDESKKIIREIHKKKEDKHQE